MKRILLALFLAAIPAQLCATPLWQSAQSGMTQAQVREAFPDAGPPLEISTLGSGAKCELQIRDYEISYHQFDVCFYFSAGLLQQVSLKSQKPTRVGFEAMMELLRAKYGAELAQGEPVCEVGLLEMCRISWLTKDGTNVSMIFAAVGGRSPVLNINYQTRLVEDAAKL